MLPRVRLDALLVERGLVDTRARARALVLAGQVTVDGAVVSKAGTPTDPDAQLALSTPDHPFVGRGGLKLAHALEAFGIDVSGRVALDIGASTGGFTDVLVQGGAQHVVALDVGHGQIAWKLRQDARVTVLEGINARSLQPTRLPPTTRAFDLITVDVSFISLKLIVHCLPALLRDQGDIVLLVKPQFEAHRGEIGRKGVVRDPTVRQRVVNEVTEVVNGLGLKLAGTTPSPITGAEGNQEIFLHVVSRA